MSGAGLDDLSLGRLAIKFAQDAPTAQQQLSQRGAPAGGYTAGYRQGGGGATTIPAQVGQAASAAFGPEAGAIISMLTMLGRGPLAAQGIDITKPYESEYGGTADDTREAHAVSQATMVPYQVEAGQSAGRLINGLDQMATKMFGPRAAGMASAVWNMIPGGDQGKGMFVSQIAQAVPEIGDMMSRMDPRLITDLTPLVDATYLRNGGRFNAQDFQQLHQTFVQMRDNGQLGNVPAQVSMHAVPFAIKHIGPQVSAGQIAGLSRMAHEAQQMGFGSTYGASLDILDSFGGLSDAAKNPGGTLQYLGQLKERFRAAGLDPAQVEEMSRLAKSKGIPVRTMIEGHVGSTEAAKLFRDNPMQQQAMVNAANDTYANLNNSDSLKALAVMSQKSPRWKSVIDKAIASGNGRSINQLASQAMRDPTNWRLMQSADTSSIAQALSNTPGASSEMIEGEAQRFAKNTNNLELGRLLANRKEMTRRLQKQDYSGLSARTVEALSAKGRFGGRLGASFLAAQAGKKPPGPMAPVAPTAPLSRIGLDYQAPATVQPPTGAPVVAPPPKMAPAPVEPNALGV